MSDQKSAVPPAIEPPWPAPTYAWGVVGVLFVAYVFAFIDRQILALMVQPIKEDLGLTDVQISLLHGLAFALLYTFLGIPVGRVVDRGDRRGLVSIGIAFWSVMTALCGLARDFWTLFAARVGVGVGEATLTPAAYSLISDYFPPQSRARAFAVYSLGITMGGGLAWIIGGHVYDQLAAHGPINAPILGTLQPWQITFILVGLPGVLVALMTLLIKEPVRRGKLVAANDKGLSLREAFSFVAKRWDVYGVMFLGFGLISMVSYTFVWLPAHFIRDFNWTPGQYGLYAGWITIIFGSLGILVAGWIVDGLIKKGRSSSMMSVAVAFLAAAVVFCTITPLPSDPWISLGLLCIATFFLMAPFGLAPTVMQAVTPNEMRGQVSAVYLFIMNLLGLGLGPTTVALVTDYVLRDESKTGLSIAVVCGVLGPIGVALLWWSGRAHKRELAKLQAPA